MTNFDLLPKPCKVKKPLTCGVKGLWRVVPV